MAEGEKLDLQMKGRGRRDNQKFVKPVQIITTQSLCNDYAIVELKQNGQWLTSSVTIFCLAKEPRLSLATLNVSPMINEYRSQ